MGMAVACVVAASLASANPPSRGATMRPGGTTFIPNGPVSSFGAADAAGKGKTLCPGRACVTPQQLQAAYDFPSGKRAPTGAGQTIMVVVAYGSATLESDLASFDSLFGIPSTQISYCGAGNGVNPDPNFPSWAVETSADVEYAHAMAPGARIVLAVSPSDDGDDLAQTVASCAPNYPGAIISQSFGSDEDLVSPTALATFHAAFDAATAAGDTIVAGTGDFGATDFDSYAIAAYPASDPLVTAVGGTQGNPYPDGLLRGSGNGKHYGGEQVWSEQGIAPPFTVATGGAPSILFGVPDYQAPFNNNSMRTVADVSYLASINGGELIVFFGQLGNFGGTSVGPPHWAAIFALANQARSAAGEDALGQANPALYAIASDQNQYASDFHDITVGNNIANSDIGFQAGPGYDIPTGLGTPDVSNLIGGLVGSSSTHHGDGGLPKPLTSPGKSGDHHAHPGG